MKYTTTILSFSIHPDGEHPVFGDCATHVKIEDEAGGPFIVLSQCPDHPQPGEVRLDFEEVELIADAVRKLKNQPVIERLLNESNQDSEMQ